jgi:ADP-ribose pyrophosphatase YjhB (NUDIX family)
MACGGHVKENELLKEGLKREIKEELNLEINFLHYYHNFESINNQLPTPFITNYKTFDEKRLQIFEYLCRVSSTENLRINKKELLEYKLFEKDELLKSKEIKETTKEIISKAYEFLNV